MLNYWWTDIKLQALFRERKEGEGGRDRQTDREKNKEQHRVGIEGGVGEGWGMGGVFSNSPFSKPSPSQRSATQ